MVSHHQVRQSSLNFVFVLRDNSLGFLEQELVEQDFKQRSDPSKQEVDLSQIHSAVLDILA